MAGLFDEPTVAFAKVAVERGVDAYPDGLTYGIPERLSNLQPGQLVTVPLGRGNTPTSAWVLEVHKSATDLPSGTEAKQLMERDAESISLPLDLLELAKWMSAYYFTPIGITLSTMLPGPVRKGTGLVTRRLLDFPEVKPGDIALTQKQQHVIDVLASLPISSRPIEPSVLAKHACLGSQSPIATLIKKGLLKEHRVSRIEAQWFRQSKDTKVPAALTEDQVRVIDSITNDLDSG